MNDHIDASAFGLDDRFAIGQPVPRSEDPVLLRGEGRYSDDVSLPGQAFDAMVRSYHAQLAGQYDLLAATLAHSPPLAKSPHQRGARAIFGGSAPAHN